MISYAVLEVEDASPAFNIYPDSFLITVSKMISSYLSRNTFKLTYEKYKTQGNVFLTKQMEDLNESLKTLGVVCLELRMGDPELNKSIQESLEAEAKAEQLARAQKRKGEGQKAYDILVSEGQSKAISNLSAANATRFAELIKLYETKGLGGPEAVREANAMISAEFNADAVRHLQGTYVASGGGVQLAVMERRPSANANTHAEVSDHRTAAGNQPVAQSPTQPDRPVAQTPVATATAPNVQAPRQNQSVVHSGKRRRRER